MGAHFSFTCGNFAARGGFGLQMGRPGNQQLFVGVKDEAPGNEGSIRCLPFFEGAKTDAAQAFQVGQPNGTSAKLAVVQSYPADQLRRCYGWATDRWITSDFDFVIYTPFGSIPDPAHATPTEMRDALLPAVVAELTVDNTNGSATKTGFFAVDFPTAGAFASQEPLKFGFRRAEGVLGQTTSPSSTFMRWNITQALTDINATHQLGNCPGIRFSVPAGEKQTLRLALGVYLDGLVTNGIEGRYLYTRYFSSLDDVLQHALDRFDSIISRCQQLDQQLSASGLSADQQFLIAHSTRSYYGSTQLLEVGGEPFWIVNEGEYCMLNTLDLSVDHVFWELDHSPWLVRNLLDNFVRHYSYVDSVGLGADKTRPGGISFCHDMGVHNNFSRPGHSSYELSHLNALCFSYMTCEELCNWILMAASYVAKTDDLDWAKSQQPVLDACLSSLLNRCGDRGFVQFDSSRCAEGAEITTYDSLDHSLAQTRNNVYMAVKCIVSFQGLAMVLGKLASESTKRALAAMEAGSAAVLAEVLPDGLLPAVFENDNPGHGSRILPAAEGLIYSWYWSKYQSLSSTPSTPLLQQALLGHTRALLTDDQQRNFFPDGGVRLSSTSNNSWMSKIAIIQHVVRKVFLLDQDPSIATTLAKGDSAHVKWMTTGESAYWACSDQFVDGVAKGSKYYPRIITTALWMEQ